MPPPAPPNTSHSHCPPTHIHPHPALLPHPSEALYGRALAQYLDDPANLVVVSSDFCHWGSRFTFTFHDTSKVSSSSSLAHTSPLLQPHGLARTSPLLLPYGLALLQPCGLARMSPLLQPHGLASTSPLQQPHALASTSPPLLLPRALASTSPPLLQPHGLASTSPLLQPHPPGNGQPFISQWPALHLHFKIGVTVTPFYLPLPLCPSLPTHPPTFLPACLPTFLPVCSEQGSIWQSVQWLDEEGMRLIEEVRGRQAGTLTDHDRLRQA